VLEFNREIFSSQQEQFIAILSEKILNIWFNLGNLAQFRRNTCKRMAEHFYTYENEILYGHSVISNLSLGVLF